MKSVASSREVEKRRKLSISMAMLQSIKTLFHVAKWDHVALSALIDVNISCARFTQNIESKNERKKS